MTENIIETIVNEAVKTEAEAPEVVETKVETPEVEAQETVEVEAKPKVEAQDEVSNEEDDGEEVEADGSDDESEDTERTEFSPKAKNALKRVKQEAKKRRLENKELKRQIDELKSQLEQKTELGEAPKEGDFSSYDEYLKAEMDFRVKNGVNESFRNQNQQKLASLEEQQKQAQMVEREHHMAEKYVEMTEKFSDYNDVLQQAAPILDTLPEHITDIAYAIDNAPLAFYNLAKTGQLANLANMPREMATIAIMQAQMMQPVAPTPQPKTVSAAPAPMKRVSGTAKSTKQLHQMNADELLKLIS